MMRKEYVDKIDKLASYWRGELNKTERNKIDNLKRTDYEFRELSEEIKDIVLERSRKEADDILKSMKLTYMHDSLKGDVESNDEEGDFSFEESLSEIRKHERSRRRQQMIYLVIALFFLALIVFVIVKMIS